MNIERIYLVISLIFMIIMYSKINNLEKNNKIENFKNGGRRWTVSADDAFAAGWKNQDNYDKVVVDSSNKTRDTSHSHGGKTGWSSKPDNKNEAHPYRQDNYDHATVPYAAVIQYWMRVR